MAEVLPVTELIEPEEDIFTARSPFATRISGENDQDRSVKRYVGFIFLTTMTFLFALILTYVIQAIFSNFFPKHASLSTYLLLLLAIIIVGSAIFYIGYRLFDLPKSN